MTPIIAYTAVCEEDACWVPQYLKEAERLNIPFVIYFDRCSEQTKAIISPRHRLFAGAVYQNDPKIEFTEMAKQAIFDMARKGDARWFMAWDIDETYEECAPKILERVIRLDADYVTTKWVNLWETPDKIRVDGAFSDGRRVKFYNARRKWKFYHATVNGARCMDPVEHEPILAHTNLVCLHWGLMTHELRVLHKQRWDRIYGKAVGENPYGFWRAALDYSTLKVEDNPY